MGGCTCSEPVGVRRLTSAGDFAQLAACCRRLAVFRPGRVEVAVPSLAPDDRERLEQRINDLWQACGCGEAAVAMWIALALWLAGLHPFAGWRAGASTMAAAGGAFGFVATIVTMVKLAAIVAAHQRLARLLERQGAALRG